MGSFLREVSNPPNPYLSTDVEYLPEQADDVKMARLQVFEDSTREILSSNDSPDVGFSYSVNPYRGCIHACAYCFARPSHEYLGLGAGTDFDRILTVKPKAPELLRAAFEKKSWQGDFVMFSGVTDCYQPLEASYRLTRGCLEVCLEYRNPCGVITKSPLIERDLELLVELSKVTQLYLAISIPLWDEKVARAIEPTVTTPQRRMRTVERLASAGLHVTVNVAPMIPGVGEQGMVPLLEAAKAAGARSAALMYLRLPGSVADVFQERVKAALPLRADAILKKIRRARGGKLNDSRFGERHVGQGEEASTIRALFDATVKRLGLNGWNMETRDYGPPANTFRRPPRRGDQLSLL